MGVDKETENKILTKDQIIEILRALKDYIDDGHVKDYIEEVFINDVKSKRNESNDKIAEFDLKVDGGVVGQNSGNSQEGLVTLDTFQMKSGTKEVLESKLVGENKPKEREPIFELDTWRMKFGNGVDNYKDLPYFNTSTAINFAINDPQTNQALLYTKGDDSWHNKPLADNNSIIYLKDEGLVINGFKAAQENYIPVKDHDGRLTWKEYISQAKLDEKVELAKAAAIRANTSATEAASAQAEAENQAKIAQIINESTIDYVDNKFWSGSLDEYNKLESITEGSIYFVRNAKKN